MTMLLPGVARLPQSAFAANLAQALNFGQATAARGFLMKAQGAGVPIVTAAPQLLGQPTAVINSGIGRFNTMGHGNGFQQLGTLFNIARGTNAVVPVSGLLPGAVTAVPQQLVINALQHAAVQPTLLQPAVTTIVGRGIEAPMIPAVTTSLLNRAQGAVATVGGQVQRIASGIEIAAPTIVASARTIPMATTSLVGRLSTAAAGGMPQMINTSQIASTVANVSGYATRLAERA